MAAGFARPPYGAAFVPCDVMTTANLTPARMRPADLNGDGAASPELLRELLLADDGLCLSIILPTVRATRDTDQNRIAFKSALKEARHEISTEQSDALEEVFNELAKLDSDSDFWANQMESLVVYASAQRRHVLRMPRTLRPFVGVADSFHLKPLIRVLQTSDRFQLLAITQKSVRLYDGDRDGLTPVSLHDDVPRDLVDALGGELDDFHLTVASYNGVRGPGAMHHGHHDKSDEQDIDLERYFRAIDKAIWEHHSRRAGVPLILAAVDAYHTPFRKVSKNQHLLEQGVKLNPDSVDVDEKRLLQEVRAITEPMRHEKVRQALEDFGTAQAKGQGSSDLREVVKAATQGRVARLLVDGDKRIGGKIDADTGDFREADVSAGDVDDVLDDLAEHVLRNGGDVMILPGDVHSQKSGVAAIYRY